MNDLLKYKVEASTTKDVDQRLMEVKEGLNEFFAKEEKNKEKNLIDGMTPKQHHQWKVDQQKEGAELYTPSLSDK